LEEQLGKLTEALKELTREMMKTREEEREDD
jgi:hypothetical protein